MANIPVDDGKFVLVQEINGAGTVTNTLSTQNTFVDKNIVFQTVTPSGALGSGTGSASATSDTGILGTASSTQPSSGHYVKVAGTANVAVSTSGWVDSGTDVDVSIADVYYPMANATFTVDGASVKTSAEGYVANNTTVGTVASGVLAVTGGTLTAGSGTTALASDGLSNGTSIDATKKIALSEVNANGYYELEASGSGSVSRGAIYKQQTTAGYMTADGSPVQQIASDSASSNTATKKYYVLQSTLSASSITPATTVQTVTIGAGYYHDSRTVTIAAMGAGTATSSTANTGLSTYFNSGTSSSYDVSITPQHSITVAGFLDATANPVNGTPAYYKIKTQTVTETTTTVSSTTATRGTRTESVGWKGTAETLTTATFANEATSGQSYVDISATTAAPVLVSNDYLYINKGWTDNLKISLARLVPDGSDVKGHGEYILSGHSAYDDDGVLVAGSIPTYAGAYTVA